MTPYDVYICGAEAESESASSLARKLRAYRIPRKAAAPSSLASYKRVLVDTEGLPLLDEDRASLEKCRHFIVMCSPESRASAAVMDKLACFEAEHGKTEVIAVLCSGEPADAFPPSFIERRVVPHMLPDGSVEEREETIEPVASDLRGRTKSEKRRLLRYETVRIVATIMGIAPDALERRHNRRARRRATVIASILCAVLAATGTAFAYYGTMAAREGRIAAMQAEQSQSAVKRIMEDVPALFENDNDALALVREGILDTIWQLAGDEDRLYDMFDLDDILAILPEDGLHTALRKAALSRALGVGAASEAYSAAAERLPGDLDGNLFLQVTDAYARLPEGTAPPFALYVTRDSGALRQGDMIVAAAAQSFSCADGRIFNTHFGETNLDGALAEALPDEACSVAVLRYSGGELIALELTVSVDALSACGAVGV